MEETTATAIVWEECEDFDSALSVQDLLELIKDQRLQAISIKRNIEALEGELRQRMQDLGGATEIVGTTLKAQLSAAIARYEWNPARTRALKPLIPEYDSLVEEVVTMKVKTTSLLRLARSRGAAVAAAIDAAYVKDEVGAPKLTILSSGLSTEDAPHA